jgi:hypothetical protein
MMPVTDKFLRLGRMISGSKRGPKGHVCVFNANICIKSKGKIWFGDLDLTADAEHLKSLAAETGEDLYVLREMDARFTNEASPKYENAVAIVKIDGTITNLTGRPE